VSVARAINRWRNVRFPPNSGRVASVLKESVNARNGHSPRVSCADTSPFLTGMGVSAHRISPQIGQLRSTDSATLLLHADASRVRPYCGCAGVVAGGGVAVGVVGVEPGSKYQTRISARTTAAAMMSNLFVSMGSITVLLPLLRGN